MIDLKQYALVSDVHHTTVHVAHLDCGDRHPAVNMDDALEWAGSHVCGV